MDYTTNSHQNLPVYICLGLNHKRFINPSIRIKMIRGFLRLLNDMKLICSIPEKFDENLVLNRLISNNKTV